jgi:hypothetical protein
VLGLAVVGSEVGVKVLTFAKGISVGTEEGELVVGNMVVGAVLVGLVVVGSDDGVSVVTFSEGYSIETEDGNLVVRKMVVEKIVVGNALVPLAFVCSGSRREHGNIF